MKHSFFIVIVKVKVFIVIVVGLKIIPVATEFESLTLCNCYDASSSEL